jgi:hypothetical protein
MVIAPSKAPGPAPAAQTAELKGRAGPARFDLQVILPTVQTANAIMQGDIVNVQPKWFYEEDSRGEAAFQEERKARPAQVAGRWRPRLPFIEGGTSLQWRRESLDAAPRPLG